MPQNDQDRACPSGVTGEVGQQWQPPRHLSREEDGGCPVQVDTRSDLGAFSQFHALSKEPTARDYRKAPLPWVITWVSAKSSLF